MINLRVFIQIVFCLLSCCLIEGVRRTPSLVRESNEEETDRNNNEERLLRIRQKRREATIVDNAEPPKTPNDHLIQKLPLLQEMPTAMFAGHLPASPDHNDKKIFYWLVAPPNEEDRVSTETPLLIWLNGGPGCSSMEGFFLENGPLKFVLSADGEEQPKWKLEPNRYSWHVSPAWVLYIDQPVGTGLSFTRSGKYCKNDEEVNTDFFYFLEEFFLLYKNEFLQQDGEDGEAPPKLNRPFYFSGESHAGHYIPSMIEYNLSKRSNGSQVRVDISISGGAIGNGWIDPYHQYSVSNAAYGEGLINLSQKSHLDDMESQCQELLASGKYNSNICFDLLDLVTHQSYGRSSPTIVSQYDVTKVEKRDSAAEFPKGHRLIESYLGGLGKPNNGIWDVGSYVDVLESLHATESIGANQQYKGCTDPPYFALSWADGVGVTKELTTVLNENTRMLFYNGMDDLICNHVGNELTLAKLDQYKHVESWRMSQRFTWHPKPPPDDETISSSSSLPISAYVQESENLSFLKFPGSGHMVPMDLPYPTLEMIKTFLYNKSFKSSPQELERDDPEAKKSCEKVQR